MINIGSGLALFGVVIFFFSCICDFGAGVPTFFLKLGRGLQATERSNSVVCNNPLKIVLINWAQCLLKIANGKLSEKRHSSSVLPLEGMPLLRRLRCRSFFPVLEARCLAIAECPWKQSGQSWRSFYLWATNAYRRWNCKRLENATCSFVTLLNLDGTEPAKTWSPKWIALA